MKTSHSLVRVGALALMTTVFSSGLYQAVAQTAPAATPAPTAPATPAESAGEMAEPTAEMKSVLDALTELGAKPLGTLGVAETRAQPTPADAVMAVMEEKNINTPPEVAAVKTRDVMIPGEGGEIMGRVYTPAGEGPFPLIVYYHGGGWVIADIDTYDASARQLAAETGAVVLSSHYRQGPENKFPAAQEDAWTAYKWAIENSGDMNADATRVAVAGESAGANLAANVAIRARDERTTQPIHQLLVYPVAGNDMETESYVENADAMPLSRPAMEWFVENALPSMDAAADPRINLVGRDDLQDLPAATVINAQIDPLRTEGETYAANLEAAGVDVQQMTYAGVTHEFFGMGAVVPEAKEAMTMAATRLKAAFEGSMTTPTGAEAPAPTAAPAQ